MRSFLRRQYPEILHQFDVRHFGKLAEKTLSKIAKIEIVNRRVYGLRQLLIIFGGVALVQLAMKN